MSDNTVKFRLFILIIVSVLVRAFISASIDLSNDELNYWAYALYPDLSHFDHPPMVGFIIQLFTFNLTFQNELFIRLASVIIGALNTFIIFHIGRKIKDEATGLFAALLYNSSIYCFFIAGVFILPDTPLLLFWLISFYFLLGSLPDKGISLKSRKYIILAGMAIGLGMLSKYTAVFLWAGAFAYIIIYNRNWFKTKELYIAVLVSAIIFIPVIIWNFQNNFISFTFQGDRVSITQSRLRLDFIGTEILGQFFYNNPVNFIVIITALIAVFKKRIFINPDYQKLLLFWSLPIIILFIAFSLTKRTLPHWSAPGYTGLILIASAYLRGKTEGRIPYSIKSALALLSVVLIFGYIQIKSGLFFSDTQNTAPDNLGENDISLDLYGWNQLSEKFQEVYNRDVSSGDMQKASPIITFRWFPAANFDYYIGRKLKINTYAMGGFDNIRNYFWINNKRGMINLGQDAYFIASSRDYRNPFKLYSVNFEKIIPSDTIRITRNGKNVMNYLLYKMKGLENSFE